MKQIVGGIVTFMPDSDIISKIQLYSQIFKKIYIYDNTPNGMDFNLEDKISNIASNVVIYSNKKNDGLSKAYNYLINKTKNEYDYLCTLDQDSIFLKEDFFKMEKLLNDKNFKETAVIGPKVIYNISSQNKKIQKNKFIIKSKKYVISSGSFINLRILKNNFQLCFDENYFIDRVDTDFCTKCLRQGYKVIEVENVFLYQTLGEENKANHKFQHSYIRHYYMFRNRFYYNQKYYPFMKAIFLDDIQSLKQCIKIILFEDDKTKKLYQLFMGYKDYKSGNMGKGRY